MTEAGRLLGGEGLDRVVERMRRINSSESAYQHLLDTLADDITGAFPEQASRREITAFIRAWKP